MTGSLCDTATHICLVCRCFVIFIFFSTVISHRKRLRGAITFSYLVACSSCHKEGVLVEASSQPLVSVCSKSLECSEESSTPSPFPWICLSPDSTPKKLDIGGSTLKGIKSPQFMVSLCGILNFPRGHTGERE